MAKSIDYGDRKVQITIPFPDTIELTTDIFSHHVEEPFQMGKTAEEYYGEIDAQLKEWIAGYKTGETYFKPSPTVLKNGLKAIYRLAYDDDHPLNVATLILERRSGPSYAIWSVKLDFSASNTNDREVRLTRAIPLGALM